MKKLTLFLVMALSLCISKEVNAWNTYHQGVCPHQSTQARVQQDISHHWMPDIAVPVGSNFNVGSFHNGVDRFATDTIIEIESPSHQKWTGQNGGTYTAHEVGLYMVKVKTNNVGGWGCEQTAYVRSNKAYGYQHNQNTGYYPTSQPLISPYPTFTPYPTYRPDPPPTRIPQYDSTVCYKTTDSSLKDKFFSRMPQNSMASSNEVWEWIEINVLRRFN